MLFLKTILKNLICLGTLHIVDARGRGYTFSGQQGPEVSIRFHNNLIPWHMLIAPSMAIGEGYMEGQLTIEKGTIYDFLSLLGKNIQLCGQHPFHILIENFIRLFKRIHQFNPLSISRSNVAHHYNLSQELYQLFLDSDLQYSCAYFESSETSLEIAQEKKKRHIAAKLMMSPGQSVLDIGSGWGGLGIYIAETLGANVTGITLSDKQLKLSRKKALEKRSNLNVKFDLRDYRQQTGKFDRIVSVGMFEHVGVGYFPNFFEKCEKLLKEDGIALIHTIGRSGPPSVTDGWIRKYIFPGGYIPALSEVIPVIEKTGLIISDIEFLHMHYAETIRLWRKKFTENRAAIRNLFDERFCKMWEFYLAGSEISFRYLGMTVFQIQMTKQMGSFPLTRNYINKLEKEIASSKTN